MARTNYNYVECKVIEVSIDTSNQYSSNTWMFILTSVLGMP